VSIPFLHCTGRANRDIQDVGEAELYQLSNKKGAAYEDTREVFCLNTYRYVRRRGSRSPSSVDYTTLDGLSRSFK
jgi:hypothetical protein